MYSLSNNVEKSILRQAFDDVLETMESKKVVSVKVKSKETAYLWTLTTLKDDASPIELCRSMANTLVNSNMAKVDRYVACIERADGNDNWHVHLLCHHSSYFDLSKLKNLKVFKVRRIEAKKVKPTIRDLEQTLNYVLKDSGKHSEVNELYGNSIFANFDFGKKIKYSDL